MLHARAEPEVRLDFFFPRVEVFLNFVRENLAELGVDAADVGGQGLDEREKNHHRDGKPTHTETSLLHGSCCAVESFISFSSLRSLKRIRCGAFDEALGQTEARAQYAFAASHLAVVDFVVVAGEMQQAVEDQNFDFDGQRVTLFASLAQCSRHADGEIAGYFAFSR